MLILIAELIIFLGAHSFTAYRKSRLAAFALVRQPGLQRPPCAGLAGRLRPDHLGLLALPGGRTGADLVPPVLDRRHRRWC